MLINLWILIKKEPLVLLKLVEY